MTPLSVHVAYITDRQSFTPAVRNDGGTLVWRESKSARKTARKKKTASPLQQRAAHTRACNEQMQCTTVNKSTLYAERRNARAAAVERRHAVQSRNTALRSQFALPPTCATELTFDFHTVG
jgi:hypothetical protein